MPDEAGRAVRLPADMEGEGEDVGQLAAGEGGGSAGVRSDVSEVR